MSQLKKKKQLFLAFKMGFNFFMSDISYSFLLILWVKYELGIFLTAVWRFTSFRGSAPSLLNTCLSPVFLLVCLFWSFFHCHHLFVPLSLAPLSLSLSLSGVYLVLSVCLSYFPFLILTCV